MIQVFYLSFYPYFFIIDFTRLRLSLKRFTQIDKLIQLGCNFNKKFFLFMEMERVVWKAIRGVLADLLQDWRRPGRQQTSI